MKITSARLPFGCWEIFDAFIIPLLFKMADEA
jgi:hypothetical protein